MACLSLLLALILPRLALVAVWLLNGHPRPRFRHPSCCRSSASSCCRGRRLAYAVMWDNGTDAVTGFEWFIVALAFLADLAAHGGTARGRD